jgi:hypothetical protein
MDRLVRDLGWHVVRPDHSSTIVPHEGVDAEPGDQTEKRAPIEAQRAADPFLVESEIRDGDRHVQSDLEHQLRLFLEPRGNDDPSRPRIEVNVNAGALEERERHFLLRGQRRAHDDPSPRAPALPSRQRAKELARAVAAKRIGRIDAMVLRLVVVRTILATPPVPRIVPDFVFDAFGWCASRSLEWRRPASWDAASSRDLTATNPSRMIFVLRSPCEFLPLELARLHVADLELSDEWALAPYGIDAATDRLFERSVTPESLLWLAASDLPGLVWGLHDWAHFHNHGPFAARAWTELQCDAAALVWLWVNRGAVGIDDAAWHRARSALAEVAGARFAEEEEEFSDAWLSADRLFDLARSS